MNIFNSVFYNQYSMVSEIVIKIYSYYIVGVDWTIFLTLCFAYLKWSSKVCFRFRCSTDQIFWMDVAFILCCKNNISILSYLQYYYYHSNFFPNEQSHFLSEVHISYFWLITSYGSFDHNLILSYNQDTWSI